MYYYNIIIVIKLNAFHCFITECANKMCKKKFLKPALQTTNTNTHITIYVENTKLYNNRRFLIILITWD